MCESVCVHVCERLVGPSSLLFLTLESELSSRAGSCPFSPGVEEKMGLASASVTLITGAGRRESTHTHSQVITFRHISSSGTDCPAGGSLPPGQFQCCLSSSSLHDCRMDTHSGCVQCTPHV